MTMATEKDNLSPSQRERLRKLLDGVADDGEDQTSQPPKTDDTAPSNTNQQVGATADLPSESSPKNASQPLGNRFKEMKVGPYRVKRLIGGGGMGQVYEALQEHPRRTVALKVMRASIDSEAARRRFEYEAQILARLHHPNIAQIFDAGMWKDEDRELPYFVMEYVAGKTLDDYVRGRSLPFKDRLRLFAQICDAVSHGHERGIIHRDLKPGNVLVDGDGHIKVIDFGVARATDSDMRMTQAQTSAGQIVGTIQYMSPEQCAADPHDLDIRSDVYALGVMLYEIIVDRLPYDLSKTAIHEAVRIVQEVEPTRITSVDASVPRDIEVIIGKSLEKERTRRYRSAGEMGDDVRRFLSDEAIVARPPSLSEHIRRYARKHRATTTAVVIVSISVVLAIATIIIFGIEAQRQRGIAQKEAQIALVERARAEDAVAATTAALTREQAAREDAERNARLVSKAALNLFGPVSAKMKNLPEATEAREILVTTGFELLEELHSAAGNGSDPALLGRIALGHEALGDLLGGRRTSNLGRPEEALEQYDKAEGIWRGIRLEDPDSEQAESRLALVLNKRADLLYETDPDTAISILAESRRINTDLYTRFPEQSSYIRAHYGSLELIADSYLQKGQLARALVLSTEFRDLASMLHEQDPENTVFTRDLAMSLRRIGYIRLEQAQHIESEAAYRQSLELMDSVALREPNDARKLRDVGWACWFLGEYLLNHGDREEGALLLIRSADRIVFTCTLDPNAANFRTDVANAVPAICTVLHTAGMTERAVAVHRDTLLLLQPVMEAHPENLAISELVQLIRDHEVAGAPAPH